MTDLEMYLLVFIYIITGITTATKLPKSFWVGDLAILGILVGLVWPFAWVARWIETFWCTKWDSWDD